MKLKTMKFLLVLLGVAVLLPGMSTMANAYSITPSCITEIAQGNETSQADIDAAIAGYLGSATELYKANVGEPVDEEGTLAGSYDTVFDSTPTDPSGATITYVAGAYVGPPAYLLVKDGKQDPAWYLFDLGCWDGKDPIVLSGFWTGTGAISHVTLYGNAVPIPAAAWLLGSGILGLVGIRWRSRRKEV